MKKLNKSLILLILLFNFILLSSCIETSGVNKFKPPYEVTFTKNIYADSIYELENKILNYDSYCDADLKFYYNLGFLEKYNWTMSPDYLDPNEFVYYDGQLGIRYNTKYNYLIHSTILYGLYYYTERYNNSLPTLDGCSTSDEFLKEIGTESYYYKYEERNYKTGNFSVQLYNDKTNKFNYGITYQARTIEPIYLSKDLQTYKEFKDRIESADAKICPNLMIPSLEDVESNENGFYTIPVVIKEEYENITITCRIYIDEYPIDCVIRFRYSTKINSIEDVKKHLSSINLNDYIKKKYYDDDGFEKYELKFRYDYDDPNSSHLMEYSCYVSFSAVYDKNNTISKLNKPYLYNYTNQLDEYFNTFSDGVEEINIKYRKN